MSGQRCTLKCGIQTKSCMCVREDWGEKADDSIVHKISMEKYLIPIIEEWVSK